MLSPPPSSLHVHLAIWGFWAQKWWHFKRITLLCHWTVPTTLWYRCYNPWLSSSFLSTQGKDKKGQNKAGNFSQARKAQYPQWCTFIGIALSLGPHNTSLIIVHDYSSETWKHISRFPNCALSLRSSVKVSSCKKLFQIPLVTWTPTLFHMNIHYVVCH